MDLANDEKALLQETIIEEETKIKNGVSNARFSFSDKTLFKQTSTKKKKTKRKILDHNNIIK